MGGSKQGLSLHGCLGSFRALAPYLCLLDPRQARGPGQQRASAFATGAPANSVHSAFTSPTLAAHISVGNPMRLRQMPYSGNTLALSFTWTLHLLTQESSDWIQH